MSHRLDLPHTVPVLIGESLSLREPTEEDIPGWFERATDAEAADLAGDPVPASIDLGLPWLQRHRDRFRDRQAIRWAMVPAGSAVSVGTVGLNARPDEAGRADFGIVVARAFWGRGLGTAAAALVTRYAFAKLGLLAIHAEVLQRNAGSVRLLHKAGFELVGTAPPTADEPEVLLRYVLTRQRHEAAQA